MSRYPNEIYFLLGQNGIGVAFYSLCGTEIRFLAKAYQANMCRPIYLFISLTVSSIIHKHEMS